MSLNQKRGNGVPRSALAEVIGFLRHVINDPGRTRRLLLIIVVVAIVAPSLPHLSEVPQLLGWAR